MSVKEKNSFVMYYDWEDIFTTISPEQCQRLMKAIFGFVKRGEVADFSDNLMLGLIYNQIEGTIRRDTEKYEERCRKNKEAIEKRWASANAERAECERTAFECLYEYEYETDSVYVYDLGFDNGTGFEKV